MLRSSGVPTAVLLALPFSLVPTQSRAQVDLAQLTHQLVSVTAASADPVPLFAFTEDWVPVVAGDEDTSFPSVVVMARPFGSGRVVAIGHTELLLNVDTLDNGQLAENIFLWLDSLQRRRVLYTAGHNETITAGTIEALSQRLASAGFSVESLRSPMDAQALAACGVLLVGNAKEGITGGEEDAICEFISQGGGLCLAAGSHPVLSFQEWRMTALGERFQMRWLQGAVDDPTDLFENKVFFHRFGKDISGASTAQGAMELIAWMHSQYAEGLTAHIQTNASDALMLARAHRMLSLPTMEKHEFPMDHPIREDIGHFCCGLAESNAVFYSRVTPFPEETASHATWVRERFWRTWADVLPLTPERRSEMLAACSVTGARAEILTQHGIVILDNLGLDEPAAVFIRDLLDAIPGDLHDLHAITADGYFGQAPDPDWLASPRSFRQEGSGQAINASRGPLTASTNHNSFPPDVPPVPDSLFCTVTIHEVNHSVTAHWLVPSESLLARRGQLIADAGTNHMNYLRSMIADGVFAEAPQEFFASISQQWFADSERTMALGLLRHAAGYPHPINQALFFADVYSQDTDSTWFYRTSNMGSIVRYAVPLRRNALGHIVGIATNGRWLDFDVDPQGRVLSFGESFRIRHASLPGAIELTFPTAASRTYAVYGSANLNGTRWERLHELQELTGGVARLTFPTSTSEIAQLFRVQESSR